MTLETEYYEYLYTQLGNYGLLLNDRDTLPSAAHQSFDLLHFSENIIPRIQNEIGVGFENIFYANAYKALLVRENYAKDSSYILERTAVYFTVLGCILDFLIDYGTLEQREKAFAYLQWEYCKDYFCDFHVRKTDSVVDELFEYVGTGMRFLKKQNENQYQEILLLMQKSADSELYVSGEKSLNQSATDKSIAFAMITLKFIVADLSEVDDSFFEHIAYAIQIIDDLCDVFEDEKNGQINPILSQLHSTDNYQIMIDHKIAELVYHLECIKKCNNEGIKKFILYEIKEWCMGCKYIRERVWKIG